MHKLTLKKMLYLFMVVICILMLGVDLYAGMIYCRDLSSQQMAYTNQTLEDMARQLDQRMNVIAQNLTQLSEKSSILSFIELERVDKFEKAPYIQALLDSYAETEPSMMILYLHCTEGTVMRGNSDASNTNYQLLRAYYEVVEQFGLDKAYREPRYGRVYSAGEDGYRDDMYLMAVTVPIFDMEYCGSLVALIDISVLAEHVVNSAEPMLLLCDGMPMWSTDELLYEAAMVSALPEMMMFNSVEMDVFRADIQSLPWTLCMLVERDGLYSEMAEYLRYNMPLVVCVLLIQGALLIVIYYWIIRQVEDIARQMEHIGVEGDDGGRKISISYRSSNEIVMLARGINGMLRRVDTLNRQINQAKIDYLDQHILFLQLQINPHFLFNALSSMRGMASRQSWENVCAMTDSMASIYRYCMDGDTMSEVSKELESIRWCAKTFEIRYREEVELRCETDPAVVQCEVPRMMLQPLVENAFLHSFAKRGYRGGMLRVVSRPVGEWLVIELENDGPEVDDAVLARMNGGVNIEQKYRGIGIVNVRRRIELLGGEGAGLTYRKREGGGVIASIRFPLRRKK